MSDSKWLDAAPGNRRGFTLIELMVVMAVVTVLAAVAFPSFLESVRKGRRADAVAALTQLQQSQERWRASNASYATAVSMPVSNYYTFAIDAADASGYTLSANAISGTSQASDTHCTTMRLRLAGGNVQYGGCAGCAVPGGALSDPNRCWSR